MGKPASRQSSIIRCVLEPDFFDVAGEVEGLGDERVGRDAGLVVAQIVEAEVAGEDLVGKRTELLCYSDRVLLLKRISVVGS